MTMDLDLSRPSALPLPHPEARQVDDGILVACGLALGAGLIHVAATVEHLHHYAPHGIFFAVVAAGQLALSVALYRSTSSSLLTFGAVASILVVMVWALSRTLGLPVGPTPWDAEPVGVLDTIASADELVLAFLIAIQLRAPSERPVAMAGKRVAMGAGLFLITLGALALVGVKHAH